MRVKIVFAEKDNLAVHERLARLLADLLKRPEPLEPRTPPATPKATEARRKR